MAEIKQTIQENLEDLLKKMGFLDWKIIFKEATSDEPLIVHLNVGEEADLLIGERGYNLMSLEHMLKTLVRRKTKESPKFILDVNDYRKHHYDYIKELARNSAQRARLTKRSITLPPMNAYERRIVHIELASRPDIITESLGEGISRRVIVKPYL